MFAIFVATGGSQRPLFEPGAPATHSSTLAVLEDGAEEVPSAVRLVQALRKRQYIYIYIYVQNIHNVVYMVLLLVRLYVCTYIFGLYGF